MSLFLALADVQRGDLDVGRLRSSTFRLSSSAISMSLTGSRFSSESAPGPFHHGVRGRGRTIFQATVSSGSSGRAYLPHPSSREGQPSTAGWISLYDGSRDGTTRQMSACVLSGHHSGAGRRLLSGAERTWSRADGTSGFDPKLTSGFPSHRVERNRPS